MQPGAIVFRWGSAVRGREQQSIEVFGESAAYFDDLVKNNRLDSHAPYLSMNRNGGMWVLQGDLEQFPAIQAEEAFFRLVGKVQMLVEDFSMEVCAGGSADALGQMIGMFSELAEEVR